MSTLLPTVFHAHEHETMDDYSAIPVADEKGILIDFIGQIVKSEVVKTIAAISDDSNCGRRLNMQVKILEGDHVDRIIFIGLNVANPNPVAVEISMKELRSIADACGVAEVVDSQQLHMIPFGFNMKLIPASDQYPEKNEIKKYWALEGTGAAATSDPFGEDED